MSGYGAFAEVYDQLTGNIDYPARARYFDRILQSYPLPGNILLDLACGTGSLSAAFSRLGYDVIGVDASCEMLSIAAEKKARQNLDIIFLQQEMESLDLYGTVDAVVCVLDSLNHLTDQNALLRALRRVALFLHPDGVFVFDVNTPYKHRHLLAEQTYVYDTGDVYCVWQNEGDATDPDLVRISLDVFVGDGYAYTRFEESFCERAYSEQTLRTLCQEAGLTVEAVYGEDSTDPPAEHEERWIFVAKKANQGF